MTAPSKPGEKCFDELKKLMLRYQNPHSIMITNISSLIQAWKMQLKESCRKLIKYCEYGIWLCKL